MKETPLNREIRQMGAMDMVRAIQGREITCEQVVRAHLDRIAAVNPGINAITRVLDDSALEAARWADRGLAKGREAPPLMGLPITVKENIDCKGSATTFGLPMLAQAVPGADAPHIARLKQAGAIVIGRTNLPDLGLRLHTDNALYGPTLNPWDPTRTPGGSSGGDAAAVAATMTPVGVGNDYGGSLRQPACFCGITALRPSLGRIPDHMSLLPSEPALTMQLFMVQGPMARKVEDLFPLVQSMSGFDPRDPHWTPAPFPTPKPDGPIRVARIRRLPGVELEPTVERGIETAAQALTEAGYRVEEAHPPRLEELWQLWFELTSAEMRAFSLPSARELASPGTLTFLDHWVDLHPACGHQGYMAGLALRNAIAREWAHFFQAHPLILGPVVHTQPFPVDQDLESPRACAAILKGYPLTMAANVLGLPAVALPVGRAEGLPLGVQLVGARFHEKTCLIAAQAIQDRVGGITPPL